MNFGEYRQKYKEKPDNIYKPHAHHIVFKVGNGERQKELVKEG